MKQWIFAARKHAQLTQAQLGEELGLTKGNVSAWENGHHEASHDQLIRIAAITGFREPLPGMTHAMAEPIADYHTSRRWPFKRVDSAKVANLTETDLNMLEAALLIAAAQVGIDIKKT